MENSQIMRQRDKSFSQQVSYANRERPAGRTFTQFCICPRANRRVHKNETNADSATRRETFLASPKSHCSSKVETRAALRSILCENFDHATKAEHPWWQHSGNPNTLICFWIFKRQKWKETSTQHVCWFKHKDVQPQLARLAALLEDNHGRLACWRADADLVVSSPARRLLFTSPTAHKTKRVSWRTKLCTSGGWGDSGTDTAVHH